MLALLASSKHAIRRCLFLHVDTGRFTWKDQPMLRGYYNVFASTDDGHLILEPASRNSSICLLNPISGHHVRFPVTTAQFFGANQFGLGRGRSIFGAGSSPMVLYSQFNSFAGGCIDPTWDDAGSNRESLFRALPTLHMLTAMVPFKGRAYAVDKIGSVAVVEHNCRLDEKPVLNTIVTKKWDWLLDRRTFIVDNAGELLLVGFLASDQKEMQVFRVDVKNGVLEQTKSIGNRAIFLGGHRSLSVDAHNLQAIECNCIYYISTGGICVHRLNDGSHMELSEPIGRFVGGEGLMGKYYPKSLARILMEHAYWGN